MVDNITNKDEIPSFVRDLMPHASESELLEAKERFDRYIDLLIRIGQRIASDPVALKALQDAYPQLTFEFESATVDSEE